MTQQYQTALIVGRFQPFHNGHLYLLRTALQIADQIVIAVGSSNSTDQDNNPLSFSARRALLEKVVAHEGWQTKVKKIVASPDFPSDEVWLRTLLENVGEFEVAVGNNDWTNGVLSQAGYDIVEIPLLKREEFQGTYIRQRIRANESWQERVPEYLISDIHKHF